MDDGAGGAYSEVNSSNDAAVRGQPLLSTLKITTPTTADTGKDFKIYVTAFNVEYSFNSDIATIRLGDVPDNPSSAPSKASTSSSTHLDISVTAVTATNGLALTTYQIEMDKNDGNGY